MLRALGRRHAAAAAAVAAGLGLVATRRQSECDAAPAPHITGVLVLFRHGARSPVFALPDNDGQVYDAVTAAPPHAPEVTISNARNAWGGNKNGLLTTVGWAQGEALGRHLRRRYGAPAEPPMVRSTDVMRTVLTAHAVITGLYAADAAAPDGIVIEVERRTALHAPLWCTPLATLMLEGRAEARRDARSRCAYANLQAAYAGQRVAAIAVHDDCQARRFHAKDPSDAVDVALCDAATREAAREIATALANGGDETARLSAGPLCAQVGEIVRQLSASCNRERARPNMVLLSGHDTSLFQARAPSAPSQLPPHRIAPLAPTAPSAPSAHPPHTFHMAPASSSYSTRSTEQAAPSIVAGHRTPPASPSRSGPTTPCVCSTSSSRSRRPQTL